MFHHNLKVKRIDRFLTQAALGKAIGKNERRITLLETNRSKPTPEEVTALCAVLRVKESELFKNVK